MAAGTKVASLYAEIGADTSGLKRGLEESKSGLKGLADNLGNIKSIAVGVGGAVTILGTTFKTALELGKQGAELEMIEGRFKRLSTSIGTTADALQSRLLTAMGGMMSKAESMKAATDIISLGLARDEDSVVRLATLVGKLGWDMNQVILTFANQSTMRLDQLGLSVTDVTSKWSEFKAAGIESTKAFNLAVIEAGEAKLRLLGDTTNTSAGAFKRLEAAAADLSDALKSSLAPGLASAAEAAALLLTWNEKVGAAVQTQEKTVVKTAESYDEYARGVINARSAVTGYLLPANELDKVIRELASGNEESARTFRVLTPAMWEASRAQEGLSAETLKAVSAFDKMAYGSAAWVGSLKATSDSAGQAKSVIEGLDRTVETYNASTSAALELAGANEKLADKEKELADLNKEIAAQGPVRQVWDPKDLKASVEQQTADNAKLWASQQKLVVVNEQLAAAQKKKGESDAEYSARLAGLGAQQASLEASIAGYNDKLSVNTVIVGGATKEQLAHRDALMADIEAMKQQTKQAEGTEMIKALDARKTGAEAYTAAVKQINDTYGLFTEQELKAATSHTILIDALSNAEGLSTAQDAIIAYYKSIGDTYGALMALIAAGKNVSGDYAGGHAEAVKGQAGTAGTAPTGPRPKEYQTGGYVPYTGLAYLHAGERVLTPAQQQNVTNNTRGGDTFNFQVNDSKAAAMFSQLIRQQRAAAANARMG